MGTVPFTESVIEEAALAWLESVGWRIAFGPALAPDGTDAERTDVSGAYTPSLAEVGWA